MKLFFKNLQEFQFNKLRNLVYENLKSQYSGSYLGVIWAVIFPIMQMCIYAMLFIFIFRIKPEGLSSFGYSLLIFSGLAPLFCFGQSITAASISITKNKDLILNSYFEPELIVLKEILSNQIPGLVILLISLSLGFIFTDTKLWALILLPFIWFLLLLFVIGIGFMLSLVNLIAKDIENSLGIFIMLVTFLSPYAYTPQMVPNALKILLYLNPLSYYVLVNQQIIVYGVFPEVKLLLGTIIISFVSIFLGIKCFSIQKKLFSDYV